MREDVSGRRQRAVMATDAEWERIGRAAEASGMDLSRFLIHRALDRDPLPPEVLRRAVREMLVLARCCFPGAACKTLIDSERRKNTQASNDVRARQLVRF